MHNVLLCETKTPFIKENIISTLGSEKVLQPSSEKLTFEPHTSAVALASTKRSAAWGSEKGLLPTAVIYVDGHQGRLKLRCWNTLDKTLRSFWETENISEEQSIISDELSYCEKHFEKTHFRKPCGRYSVSLPFKENIQENVNLGDSRSIASKRLDQLSRLLDRDPILNNLYTKFIEEYLSLDHMEEITNIDDITSEEGFFLPHHGVLRAGNRSRPLIVIFNISQKTDLDISPNDVLCKGGVIQDDLFFIMLRARKHAYFFSCDISHMFRKIEIHPHQRHFQKILWKKGLNEPVQIFKLKTVTYGTTPACYLSTRVL
ncbi:DUF1758 domain-containing protein [Trichonephila inaurata madagascariensis]|uniref:DUF1758 domain-containing protein n=1 Tax=Trichonephila inaurata madagascariensis TaxID=2747483 RepID=A0A8X6XLQ8_9ARAC|nr:DUF1758 domain-containing protein [Trichonephila inaurata madagascariensis]